MKIRKSYISVALQAAQAMVVRFPCEAPLWWAEFG